MPYILANTSTSNGWRPGQVRLGDLRMSRLPDWKKSVANMETEAWSRQQRAIGQQRVAHARAAIIDARARRAPLSLRLSGLGILPLDLSSQITFGARYVFHFKASGFGVTPDPGLVAKAVAGDTNFLNAVAVAESGGIRVSFTWNGGNTSVDSASSEMQNVIADYFHNTWTRITGSSLALADLFFYAAEGGPDGQIGPPIQNQSDGSGGSGSGGFDLTSFFSGLGVGGTLAVALGAVLLLKGL